MRDALARARRFRSRAHEFQQLADTCGSMRYSKHYHLIAKHFLALAHLEEEEIVGLSKNEAPTIAPPMRPGSLVSPKLGHAPASRKIETAEARDLAKADMGSGPSPNGVSPDSEAPMQGARWHRRRVTARIWNGTHSAQQAPRGS